MKRILYIAVLLMSFIPSAMAQETSGGDKPGDKGIFTKKTVTDFDYDTLRGILELETFVVGETTVEISPVDVVLVLDRSSSMNESKMAGLKKGCGALLDQLMQLVDMGGNARIGIISYNSSAKVNQNLTELNETSIDGMKSIINALTSTGDTSQSAGLEAAYTMLNTTESADRQKMVILFTDGQPAGSGASGDFSLAQKAVASAYKLKGIATEIFAVGLFDADPSTVLIEGNLYVLEFLERVSSLYPKVASLSGSSTSFSWLGANGKTNSFLNYNGTEYYSWAQSEDDLEGIFTNIGAIIVSKADVPLESKAVVRDVMSTDCAIPEGTDIADIKVYSASCTGGDPDDGYYFGARQEESNVDITILNKTVNVTGFDYGENWVGYDASTGLYHGKKLIVQIPFVVDPAALVGKDINTLKTNDKTSGIYLDDTQVKPFEEFTVPTVSFVNIQISETGLTTAEESSVFVVERKLSGETEWTRIATVVLTADPDNPGATVSKMIMYQDNKAEYRASRLGSWSWTYSNPSDPVITPTEELIVFSFTNEKNTEITTQYRERIKDNDFKGDGTLTPGVDVYLWRNSNKKRITF